jgi:hypothetical protein
MEVIEAIKKLNKIFKTNNWTEKDIDEYVFDNFCVLFENFEPEQRALLVELTENYSWISFNDYQSGIIKAMNQVEETELSTIRTIFFFPIMRLSDEGKVKSAHSLIYMIKGLKGLLPKYRHIRFEILTKFNQLTNDAFNLAANERLFLVDDYLGSGETINDCLTEIINNSMLDAVQFKVICIACQKEIFDQLNGNGFATHTSHICFKGISDYNAAPDAAMKKQIMLNIERYIPGGSHFSLGYNQSEALITMIRTPDNTFPIFWKKHRKDGKYYDAPFSREEIFES